MRRVARAPVAKRSTNLRTPIPQQPPAGFVEVTMDDGTVTSVPAWKAAEMRREGDASNTEGNR